MTKRRAPKRSDANESQDFVINGVPCAHWEFPAAEYKDSRGAADWAWKCIEELARAFCELYCNKDSCTLKNDSDESEATRAVNGDGKRANRQRWREAQKDFHDALSYLPQCREGIDDCPSCAVVKALTCFPRLYDCGIYDFPCGLGLGSSQVDAPERKRMVREDALLCLDLSALPAMPPRELEKIKQILKAGKSVAMNIYRLISPGVARYYDEGDLCLDMPGPSTAGKSAKARVKKSKRRRQEEDLPLSSRFTERDFAKVVKVHERTVRNWKKQSGSKGLWSRAVEYRLLLATVLIWHSGKKAKRDDAIARLKSYADKYNYLPRLKELLSEATDSDFTLLPRHLKPDSSLLTTFGVRTAT